MHVQELPAAAAPFVPRGLAAKAAEKEACTARAAGDAADTGPRRDCKATTEMVQREAERERERVEASFLCFAFHQLCSSLLSDPSNREIVHIM